MFWVVGSRMPAILFLAMILTLSYDNYISVIVTNYRWLTPSAPTYSAILPDSKLLSSSPWKLGTIPAYFPAFMILILDSLSKNFRSQKTSINLGLISPFSQAYLTAGIWLLITSNVCSSSVFPLGIA